MSTIIYLIRHTQTIGNIEKRLTGRKDYEVTEEGYEFIDRLTEKLKDVKFDVAYSSTSKRTYTTIEKLAKLNNLNIKEDKDLCEMYFGKYDGMKWEQVNKINPNIKKTQNEINQIAGIPEQETTAHTRDRVYNEVRKIARENIGKNILICSHGIAIEAFMRKIEGEDFSIDREKNGQRNTSINIVKYDEKNDKFEIILLNDYSHVCDLISVIIPAYNVEKYLGECLDSVINQTYGNLEIIVVDDGSTDNTPKICDEYAKKDRRIKVIHKENAGAGAARNTALDACSGKYIAFVDSDDTIDREYFEILHKEIVENNVDFVKTDYIKYRSGIIEKEETNNFKYKRKHYNNYKFLKNFYSLGHRHEGAVFLHGKLYKKSLWNNTRVSTARKGEDELTMFKVIYKAKSILEIDNKMYNYRRIPGTLSSDWRRKPRFYMEEFLEEELKFFEEKNEKEIALLVVNRLLREYRHNYSFHTKETKKSGEKFVELFNKYKESIENESYKKFYKKLTIDY